MKIIIFFKFFILVLDKPNEVTDRRLAKHLVFKTIHFQEIKKKQFLNSFSRFSTRFNYIGRIRRNQPTHYLWTQWHVTLPTLVVIAKYIFVFFLIILFFIF